MIFFKIKNMLIKWEIINDTLFENLTQDLLQNAIILSKSIIHDKCYN
jgi:hypothetical protein